MSKYKVWNVVFLINQNPPTNILFLKRSKDKKFAPNFYTGVGGKVETGETVFESALRELQEETGIKGIKLTEFARCIINNELVLHYFWGIYNGKIPESQDGKLEWVSTDNVLTKKIIPSTYAICEEWSNRGFKTNPFTIYVGEREVFETVRIVSIEKVTEGLGII